MRLILRRMMSSEDALSQVRSQLQDVQVRIAKAYECADPKMRGLEVPRLVAVSKTKPVDLILAAYQEGQRHFGENYIQELEEKANLDVVRGSCPDIRWHYIGTLQSNKIGKMVAGIPNLACVETLASEKAAKLLDAAAAKHPRDPPLSVMVQVNTSGEENKSGLEEEEAVKVATFVHSQCPNIRLAGFMTIGALQHSQSAIDQGVNPDFERLRGVRDAWCGSAGVEVGAVELSMGMSADFEAAIAAGATNVRVGSTIFGIREKKM